jgi:PAS domain S-box-containing protein
MLGDATVRHVEGDNALRFKAKLSFALQTALLALFVTIVCYFADWLGTTLILSWHTVSALWPGTAILVAVLLLVPRRIWPVLLPAGIAGFILRNVGVGLQPGVIALLHTADTIGILIAALGLSYSFNGIPRLNNVKALGKYCFFTILLASFLSSFIGAAAVGDYWSNWAIWFLSHALAFLTITPAILYWVGARPAWTRTSPQKWLEAISLSVAFILLSCVVFLVHWRAAPPALLYSFVPVLLWAALRFGPAGVSSSMIIISFLAIWGAVHGRGPFLSPDPLRSVLSLQLFLIFAGAPLIFLAVLAEERQEAQEALSGDITERKRAEEALRASEERFRLAAQAGKMFAYEWDAATDVIHRSPEFVDVLGFDGTTQTTGRQILDQVHAEDRERVMAALAEISHENPYLRISFRMARADGTTIWVERSSRAEFSKQGKLLRIVGMVADITERKHAEVQLRESEERFRLVATTAPIMIWMSGPDKLCTYFNQPWLTFTGRSIHEELGNGWAEGVHAEDQERCLETYKRAFDRREPFEMEYRLRRHDGEYRWIFDYGVPRFNADGSFAGYIGSASDITDQKLAQEAMEKVSGQLIEAQERERRRLARELHDDICQRLAMLSLKIEKATKATSKGDVSATTQLEQIWQQCSSLTGDVQALSHELHPSILDNLGLVTAVGSFCREVSEHNDVVVEFESNNVPGFLPSELSLSLFRMVQEALRNAVKHSGQKHFEVRLREVSGELEIEVRDEGVGFDVTNTNSGKGLGLVSMAERIHQVHGTFTIDSHPNAGTRIRARVPLNPPKVRVASAS